MVKNRPIAVLLSLAAGLLLAVGLVAPASAAATASPGAAAAARQACTIQATAFETKGNVNVVTATQTSCQAVTGSAAANVHVGYGCRDSNFEGTCWWFDVGSPGCSGGRVWTWSTIVQNNLLSSWEAVGTCSHGILYDLPGPGGASITCYTCYGLGSMNDKTSALRVYP